jgi:radical SAM family protein
MSDLKEQLYEELATKNAAMVEGIAFNPNIFKHLDLGGRYQEQVHTLFEMDHEHHVAIAFPCGFRSPNGLHIGLRWDNRSPYSLSWDDGVYHLRERGRILFPIEFDRRPKYYQYTTSDGTLMKTVAAYGREGTINVAYSNECALKEKGEDCLFCNANATKDAYGEKENIFWKNPRQIGETVAAAYREGAKHVNLTGGFIPERREVDYYLDVAEAIQEHTGLEDFNGTAVIGAPKDLKVIDKYKEAGFRTLAINIECFDKNYFNTICPGKVSHCGSYEQWLEAIGYAASVFGFGRVRSGIVAGIEPKEKTLEGVEYFASLGVITLAGAWCANPGSALEGHRTPLPAWHLDMAKKAAAIARKAGFTYDQLYDTAPSPTFLVHDIYRIEDELLPAFKKQAA